jgi:hypothetical protein
VKSSAVDILIQLVPLMLMQAVALFAVVPLAIRSSKYAWAWIVFAIVPGLGAFAFPLLLGRGVATLLGRVEELSSRTETKQAR